MTALVLGPVLRYADDRAATLWVQTDAPCEVEILGARERTWCVDGHHFALVTVEGLAPGEDHPYEVRLDGQLVWPQDDSAFPPSTIRLIGDGRRDIICGSCRITAPHEPPYVLRAHEHPKGQGIDALRTLALQLAREGGGKACPDLLLMLGDQIYADQPSPTLQEVMEGEKLEDFPTYALSYREAWSEPAIRWLLSTVPTAMIFDDHEIHAEWRISQGWLDEKNAEPWFDRHIRAGLMAYWVFQHIGNLSPATLAEGGLLDEVRAAADAGELLAARMDTEGKQTGHSRWSYARDVGDARLVVIDSRAGREVRPGHRELIQDAEWRWVREEATRPARHLLLASSVPFLLAPGLHSAEAFDEALTEGAWGRLAAVAGEKLRRLAVMDHWASFQRTFRKFAELIDDVAHGRCGEAPASVVMLSGDVHHCYLAQVGFPPGGGPHSPVWQAVCSAYRKELAPHERVVLAFGHKPVAERIGRWLTRAAGVPAVPFGWRVVERPAYANAVGVLTLDGDRSCFSVEAVAGEWDDPRLETSFARDLTRRKSASNPA
jgi:hypothetical protein